MLEPQLSHRRYSSETPKSKHKNQCWVATEIPMSYREDAKETLRSRRRAAAESTLNSIDVAVVSLQSCHGTAEKLPRSRHVSTMEPPWSCLGTTLEQSQPTAEQSWGHLRATTEPRWSPKGFFTELPRSNYGAAKQPPQNNGGATTKVLRRVQPFCRRGATTEPL